MTRAMIVAVVACSLFVPCGSSFGADYPTKPVQIVVPMAPGGSADVINRMLVDKLRALAGQPFVVVNKPGANGAVGMQSVLSAKPDGYNLYTAVGAGMAYYHLMTPGYTHNFLADFTAVGAYASYPLVVVVNKDLPVKSLRELAAYAKKNPKALTYGTTGYGSAGHFVVELFKQSAGIADESMPPVHYPGVSPSITALLGGQTLAAIMPLSSVVAKQIEAREIRPLAVTSVKRSPFRGEIPTFAEQGFGDLSIKDYLSYWVPAKTPAEVVKKLEEMTRKVTEDRETRTRIEGVYHEVEFVGGSEMRRQFEARTAQLTPLIRKLNMKVR